MSITEQLAEIPWGLVWPLIAIQLVLMTAALIDLNKKRSTNGPIILWVFIIIFINTIGPILYFTVGRRHS